MTHWWEEFFSGLWLEVQRQHQVDHTVAQADFLERSLELAPDSRVLDVPCGEGRLSVEIASRGYHVTGVDITPVLIEEARSKAAERDLEVEWERRDMRDLPWEGEFDAAFCFWGSFGYFDDSGNRAFLEAVSRTLRPGAHFLVDVPNVAEGILPRFQEHGWWQSGELLVIEDRSYDFAASRIDVAWTVVKEGLQEQRWSSVRVYTYRELIKLLSEVGFSNFEAYSSLERDPFAMGCRLYLVAKKASH